MVWSEEECFTVETSNMVLSAPLKQLKDEHVSLRQDMNLFYEITEEIESDSGLVVVQLFAKLHERISAEQAGSSIDENAAQWISVYAVQAYATLTQHFAKEEKVLFPLAEKILSVDEKKELERLFQVC
jgi:regulator of cell morphogenesis and NO signaling